jgi:hypothetical protein
VRSCFSFVENFQPALDAKSTCRHSRTVATKQKDNPTARQILGFSLPPELAAEVKMEAARKNQSLKKLFLEMWKLYKKKNTGR